MSPQPVPGRREVLSSIRRLFAFAALALAPVAFADAPPADPRPQESDPGEKQTEGEKDEKDETKKPDDDKTTEPPKEWREKVAVTAQLDGTTSAPLGASSTVIDPETNEGPSGSVLELVAAVPGVSQNGQGGLFQTYTIRGISRQRVLSLVEGARITSERRAGVSVGWIDPLLIGSIDVVRSPATTFYGSGALGGVIQVYPTRERATAFDFGWESNDNEAFQSVRTGGEGWVLGFAHRTADEGEDGSGREIATQFNQTSVVFRKSWEREDGPSFDLLLIPTYGDDIGKPNLDAPERTTTYPRERHGLLRFGARWAEDREASIWVHLQDLETRVEDTTADEVSRVFNDSLDFGANFRDLIRIGDGLDLRVGADWFARRSVDAREEIFGLGDESQGPIRTAATIDGAEEDEVGAYAAVTGRKNRLEWEAGARVSHDEQSNSTSDGKDLTSVSGFGGVAIDIGAHWRVRAGVGTGLRYPSLSERFFTGTTGRGLVVGNADLDSERSLSSEVTVRWLSRRLSVNGTLFRTAVDDYVERIEIQEDPRIRTSVNLGEGVIQGGEIQGLYEISEAWLFTWGGHRIEGRSDDDEPLADVPPDELYFEVNGRQGRLRYGLRMTARFRKNDPGPGEVVIGAAELLSASLRVRVAPRLELSVRGQNLLDEDYQSSADDLATSDLGRSVGIALHWGG